jgi:MFS family permease
VGTGAQWPIGAAFLTESVPAKKRGLALGIMQAGYPVGYFISALIFALIVHFSLSWRGCYIIPVIPGLIVLWLCTRLKESDRWEAERALKEKRKAAGEDVKHANYAELLKKGYRKYTTIAIVMHFCGGFYAWALIIWFPSILMLDFKIDKMTTSYITMVMWAVAGVGYVSAGPISDRIGRKPTMALYQSGSLVTAIIILWLKSSVGLAAPQWSLWVLACSAGWCMGAWTVLITYSTEIFPTRIRSLGTGFAVGVGRVGPVLAPGVLGAIAQHYTVSVGLLIAACLGMMMVLAMLFGPETAMKRLEDIVQ